MKAIEFQMKVKAAFLKQFPNGYINISGHRLGGGCSIYCGLIGDIKDVGGNIRLNDPVMFRSHIHDDKFIFNDDNTELDNVVIEFNGVSVSVLPKSQYLYCSQEKVPVRKINATPEKAVESMGKYFKKLKDTVTALSQANQIIQQDKIPAKYL